MKKNKTIQNTFCLIFLFFTIIRGTLNAEEIKLGLIYSKNQAQQLSQGNDPLKKYKEAIIKHKATFLEISPLMKEKKIKKRLKSISGLLIPAENSPIDPSLYGKKPRRFLGKINPEFDKFEIKILKYAVLKKMPIIGISRGCLLINVFFGGTLYQNISYQLNGIRKISHRPFGESETNNCTHMINVSPHTYLYHVLMESRRIQVNSNHQEAIRRLAPGFDVMARADDGIIEAIIYSKKPFILGLQFRPEEMIEKDPRFNKFFEKLSKEANKYKKSIK